MAAADEAEFGKRLAADLTLIATFEGSPVGFASLKRQRPHPHALRASRGERGRAWRPCCAMRWRNWPAAAARPACRSKPATTRRNDSSPSAATRRSSATASPVGDEWLANTTMKKTLGASQ